MSTWIRMATRSGGTALGLVLLSTLPAVAQDGGQRLIFGVSQTLSYETNPDFVGSGENAGALGTTNLSFAFRDDTPTESFALTAASGLRFGETDLSTVITPNIGLRYSRESANSSLTASASWTRADIEEAATVTDFVTEDGTLDLPVDFDLLDPVLNGTRTATSVQARLETGRTDPLGYTLSARLGQITYDGDAARVLDDTQTLSLGVGVSLLIDPVTQGNITLNYTRFDTDAAGEDTARWGLNTRLQRDTPRGPLTLAFGVRELDDGTRFDLNTSRTIALPRTNLTFGAGLSQNTQGNLDITGSFQGQTSLPTGRISYGLSQEFAAVNAGTDTKVSRVNGAWVHDINPTNQINVSFTYLQSQSDLSRTERTGISASYNHALTPDWTLQTGVTLNAQKLTGEGEVRNESVFVSLSRSFTTLP